MGSIFEKTEWKDRAEEYSLKIFDYLLVEPPDINAPFHHAIRNFKKKGLVGQDALMRIIRCCPLYRFKLRNKEGQTPLWLAVSTNEEEVIIAMIKRLRDPQQQFWIDPTIFDATDPRGLSILTTAIMAGCSLRLIDALIQCGSKVNPPPRPDAPSTPLPDAPSTPLRAASIPGCERPEVVWLLLRHQANPGDICPGSSIAVLVAKGLLPEPAYVPLLPKLDQ
ncbi:hypothetical protein N431DRAFT_441036 [Stipitochalara longipes BDJ]|nr:hypothetical protein N431DRAFT_441036 [Stipitochalara longipes BDJ]